MSLTKDIKKFEKHHALILVFLFIAIVFLINIATFSSVYDSVAKISPSKPNVIVNPYGSGDESAPKTEVLTELKDQLEAIVAAEDVESAVYLKDLSTGEVVGVNEKTTFVSASLYKIFVSYEIARQIDLGVLDPAEDTGFESEGVSIKECLRRTLSYSDNDCGRALRKLISADITPIPATAQAGFVGTSLLNDYPTTSARDTGLFFDRLYDGDAFTDDTNALLLEPLFAQEINDRLPVPLPSDIKIAHKTADLDGYSHDGGVFYTPGGDYVLVVLSGPWQNGYTDAPSLHISVSKLVYEWYNGSQVTADY